MKFEDVFCNALASNAFRVDGGRDLFMEMVEPSTRQTWMTIAPISLAEAKAFHPEGPFVKTGIGYASMDAAAFNKSPDKDEPLLMTSGGREFINVARPEGTDQALTPGQPMRVMVSKAHVLGFKPGRKIAYLSMPEGLFIEVVGTTEKDADRVFPEGAEYKTMTLDAPLVVTLPTPTTTFFWFDLTADGAVADRSFQGPVNLPQ
jgi:hypothetical protein